MNPANAAALSPDAGGGVCMFITAVPIIKLFVWGEG